MIARLKSRLGEFWWYSILLFVSCRFGDVVSAFIGVWLVPRYVGSDELGAVLPLAQAANAWAAPLMVFTCPFLKYVTVFSTNREYGKLKSLLRCVFVAAVVYAGISALTVRLVLPHFFTRIRVAEGSLGTLIIASGLVSAVFPFFNSALQGLKKFTVISVLNVLVSPVRLLAMLILLPLRPLSGYLAGQSVGPLLIIGISLVALRKELGRTVKTVAFWRDDWREMTRYTLPFMFNVFIASVSGAWIALLVRQRLPEVESAAYYMLSRFAEVGTYAGMTLATVVFPLVAEAKEKGIEKKSLFYGSYFGTLLPGMVLAAAFVFAGEWIFGLIDDWKVYVPYAKWLPLLTVVFVLRLCVSNYTLYEFARSRFGCLWWHLSLLLIEAGFLAVCSGIGFFNGYVPSSLIAAIESWNPCSIRFYFVVFTAFALLENVALWIHRGIYDRSIRSS